MSDLGGQRTYVNGRLVTSLPSRWLKLLRPALVISHEFSKTIVLGTGSIVEQLNPSAELGEPGAAVVAWTDGHGVEHTGRIARNAVVDALGGGKWRSTALPHDPSEALSSWDVVRGRIAKSELLPAEWFTKQGQKYLAELEGIIREFGGIVKKSDDPQAVVAKAQRLALQPVGGTMKADEQAAAPAKASAAKKTKSAKKSSEREVKRAVAKSADGEGRASMAETASEKAQTLLAKAKAPADIIKLARKLGDGGLSSKQLLTLRDGINAAAGEVRESKPSLASELSALNRTVRRLQRSAS